MPSPPTRRSVERPNDVLAGRGPAQGVEVLIVTGDTDTFQLIGPHVRVLTSRRNFGETITYDEAGIRERYGLEPGQFNRLQGSDRR